jgi:hypothetical protein
MSDDIQDLYKHISPDIWFDMPVGCYCGLLLNKRLGIRVQKLLMKQTQEIKELLLANLDETEVSHWSLCYPNGKQETYNYIDKSLGGEDEKRQRVGSLDKAYNVRRKERVFIGDRKTLAKIAEDLFKLSTDQEGGDDE